MSARDDLDAAIRAFAAEEWGDADLIVDWTIAVGLIDAEGDCAAGTIHSRDPMPRYIARGLLAEATEALG